jgi:hypothetical protein
LPPGKFYPQEKISLNKARDAIQVGELRLKAELEL